MKSNFPFTDYDFYGYIAAGLAILVFADYFLNSGGFFGQEKFTFITGTAVLAASYVAGHILAAPSQAFLENLILLRVLPKPTNVILGISPQNFFLRAIAAVFVGHEYSPLAKKQIGKILSDISEELEKSVGELTQDEIFETAYQQARLNEYSRERLNIFLNLYGFSRNFCMALILAIPMFIFGDHGYDKKIGAAIMSVFVVCMFGRFVKFYCCYMRVIYRAYHSAKSRPPEKDKNLRFAERQIMANRNAQTPRLR